MHAGLLIFLKKRQEFNKIQSVRTFELERKQRRGKEKLTLGVIFSHVLTLNQKLCRKAIVFGY